MRISIDSDRGVALVWTMLAMTLMLSTILVGISMLEMTSGVLESQIQHYGQTPSIAKAGLFDALAWFRRQTTQPVIAFTPQRDMVSIPIVNDTDDPTIGIVREIDMDQSANIFGRYEVISSTVTDISSQRGFAGAGTIWNIESIGYIYRRLDPTKAYNVWPNQVLARNILAVDIRRVSMVLPAEAALCTYNAGSTTIGNKGKVIGNTKTGIAYRTGSGTLTLDAGSTVTGTPATNPIPLPYNDSCSSVFGMSEDELKSIADYYVTNENDIPVPIPNYKIVFFDSGPGGATFNSSRPLKGTGIFYCTGNVIIAANSGSSYNGIIYCAGNYQQLAPSQINGSVIVKGNANVIGSGDISAINYDATVLSQIRTYTGQYRFAKGFFLKE
ncbi:MAG: hypothetical protein HZA49_01060 [Planctomycetes bacterium]|nr:hypothetical protein [Planctomycetota bacterium]